MFALWVVGEVCPGKSHIVEICIVVMKKCYATLKIYRFLISLSQ